MRSNERIFFYSVNRTHVAIAQLIDDKTINLSFQRSVNRWMVIMCAPHIIHICMFCVRSISLGVLSLPPFIELSLRLSFSHSHCPFICWIVAHCIEILAIVAEISHSFYISLRPECSVAYTILSFFIRILKMCDNVASYARLHRDIVNRARCSQNNFQFDISALLIDFVRARCFCSFTHMTNEWACVWKEHSSFDQIDNEMVEQCRYTVLNAYCAWHVTFNKSVMCVFEFIAMSRIWLAIGKFVRVSQLILTLS